MDELTGNFNFICDHTHLFPLKSPFPKTYHIIGPLFFDFNSRFATAIKNEKRDGKTIIVSLGSSGNPQSLEVFKNPLFSEFNFIVAGIENSYRQRQNFSYYPHLNFSKIMPQADLLVCHGGNGSIYQALACGVPVLCFPEDFEQFWNAERVVACGAGDILEQDASAIEVLKIITKSLDDEKKSKVQAFQAEFAVSKSKEKFRARILELHGISNDQINQPRRTVSQWQ